MPVSETERGELLELTSAIISAYVANNAVGTADLSGVIGSVFGTLSELGKPAEPEIELSPVVPIKKSVTKEFLVCLECGNRQKMLKRHLATAHGMTPEEYRAKWKLSYDYPMIAPAYAFKRREIAKEIGLGKKSKKARPARKRRS